MQLPFDRTKAIASAPGRPTKVILAARIAAVAAGYATWFNGREPSLHLTILLKNYQNYWVYGLDGQPDRLMQAPSRKLIVSNFYRNEMPSGILKSKYLAPPSGMSDEDFADALANAGHNFFGSTVNYSFPAGITGRRMLHGEYNSSSYVAGLLCSVYGYLPQINFPGYVLPGWDNPIPAHYFRSGPNGAPR